MMEITAVRKGKREYLYHCSSDEGVKGTVRNEARYLLKWDCL